MKKFLLALLTLLVLAMPVLADGVNRPVAIRTDEGVYLSWPMETNGQEYTVYRNGEAIATTKITNYTDVGADGSAEYRINSTAVSVWDKQYLEVPISVPTPYDSEIPDSLRHVTIKPVSGSEMSIGSAWSMLPLDDGNNVLINEAGQVMDVNAQATTPDGKVGTYAYNNGDNQKYSLEETSGGYYIKGKQSGLYLSVDAAGAVTIQEQANATVFTVTDISDEHSEAALATVHSIISPATYSANDASIGDLDGDGEWEIVLKWDPSDAKDASQQGTTGRVFIDAYKLDGTLMWRIDLGNNIRAGAHDTQFLVYDLDGDGKAEVAFRTADGTIDGTGAVIGDPDVIWTNNWSGKNLEGPLWVTVFDGKTGAALSSVPFDPQSGEPSIDIFGDNYGNRSERYNACVAYLDGEKPYMVFQRGYYGGREGSGPGRTVVAAYSFENNQITKYWRFDTMDEGNEKYIGQGNHNVSVGDVDGDGKDEILFGALTLDHDGSVLWCSFMGHGDAMHLSDLDPFRYGLEFFVVHEHAIEGQHYGFTVFDAATGEVLQAREAGQDTGRGVAANIGPFGGTYVAWAGAGAGKINSLGEDLNYGFNTMNFRIYWDGDLYEELLDGTAIFKIDDEGRQQVIFDAGRDGSASNNGSKSTPCLQADIFGDWREEVIWRSADSSVLRIYTTTTPTEFALPPLMTDHVYRMGIVWQNSSYNQPPHLGYYPAGIAELRIDSAAAKVNGMLRTLDAAPYIENERTLVPLRFIAEALGAKVDYADGIVTVEIADRAVVMPIGSEEYTINGEARIMETAPTILNGRTMVPVRAVSEALGMVVDWNGETRTITVKRGDLPEMTYESAELPMIEAGQSAAQVAELQPVRLFIAGDSTGQSYRESAAPQAGWGQMIGLFLDDSVTVQNRAMAGRSLKSFFNEGRWSSILNDAQAGDYVVIQFGHNDGDYSKEARYISHEDFAEMLENEYILPALAKGLNVIIATHTQPRWFNEEAGTIWEPGDGVSYDSIQRDMAAKYSLPLIDVNTLSRELLNRVGMEESKKIHLYADPGQYDAHPNGVADNTHYSFYGAFEIAKIVAGGFENIPGLSPRLKNGYSQAASFEGDYSFDVRAYGDGFEEYQVAISAPAGAEVSVNGAAVITKNVNGSELVTRTAAQNGKINISASMPITAEVTPVWRFAPEGGINAAEDYALDLPDGQFDFYFTKSDKERGNIFINSIMVGVNVDMYGTVGIPEGTVHTVKGFDVEGGAAIRVDQRTTRLKSVEAASTPTIFDRKTRIFVAGDSTVCNYYPIYPETVEADILLGTVRTGWAQLLHRFVSDEYEVLDLAASGDWARNWKDNIFPTVLAEGQPGDIFIIQFGINDRNRDDQKKDTMKDALKYMIEETSKKGMLPILVKPQPSVGYTWGSAGENETPNGNNGGFFNAVGEVADELGCAYVDLYALAGEHFAEVGRDYVSRNYQLWDYNADAMSDKLHISFAGARQICSLFSENASYQGLINTDGYYEVVQITDGVHVLKNGSKAKLLNLSGESRTVTLVYADGEETLTLSANEELSCAAPVEVRI